MGLKYEICIVELKTFILKYLQVFKIQIGHELCIFFKNILYPSLQKNKKSQQAFLLMEKTHKHRRKFSNCFQGKKSSPFFAFIFQDFYPKLTPRKRTKLATPPKMLKYNNLWNCGWTSL